MMFRVHHRLIRAIWASIFPELLNMEISHWYLIKEDLSFGEIARHRLPML
jgi:hypothetical protein